MIGSSWHRLLQLLYHHSQLARWVLRLVKTAVVALRITSAPSCIGLDLADVNAIPI